MKTVEGATELQMTEASTVTYLWRATVMERPGECVSGKMYRGYKSTPTRMFAHSEEANHVNDVLGRVLSKKVSEEWLVMMEVFVFLVRSLPENDDACYNKGE